MFTDKIRTHWSVILILILVVSLLPVTVSRADDLDKQLRQLEKEQEQLSKDMKNRQQALEQKQREEKSTLGELETLTSQLQALDREISRLEEELQQAEASVEQAEAELEAKIAEQDDRQQTLRARIVSIYEDGPVNYTEVLFAATSITDFLTRLEYLKAIADNDVSLLQEIEAERVEIERRKAALEQQRDAIARLKNKREQRQAELNRQQQQEQQLLTAIRDQKAEYARMLDQMDRESEKMAAEIRRLQQMRSSRSLARGKMLWPTPGYERITDDYGMRIHPILKTKRMHTGIDIAAPMGADVVAVLDGDVIFVGWNGAYGRTVIVDHGGGISAMYPHLSASMVSVNQSVRAGQKIAAVGSTGWSTGPHLHFEVRKNGDPVNPWPYLR